MRILISRLSALGDVVCSLPAAVALKDTFPESEIVWAVDSRFAGIVECCYAVDVVWRVKPTLSPSTWPRAEGAFDLALDLQGLFKSGIIVARAKAARKMGYHWQREGSFFFSARVLPDPTSHHVVDQYVDVARAAGAISDVASFGLKPAPEDLASIRSKLDEVVEQPFVVLNPGAGWTSKRWLPERFAQLADCLADRGIRSVLIGGKAEADRAVCDEVVAAANSSPMSLVGNTSVKELVALISQCRAHVGGDTGSSHIAAALGVPAIGLYSITNPRRSCPYGQVDRCHYDPISLSNIQVDAVLQGVIGVLK